MSDKKHIDRIFQEKFKDFNVSPNPNVWEGIEARLQKKKKRRIIPIWWQLGGVAAVLILLFTVGGSLFTNNSNTQETPVIVNTENSNINNTSDSNTIESAVPDNPVKNNNSSNQLNTIKQSQKSISNSQKTKSEVASSNIKTENNKLSFTKSNSVSQKKLIAGNTNKEHKSKLTNLEKTTTELKSKSKIKVLLDSNLTKETIASNEEKENSKDASNINSEEKGQDIEEAIAEANTIHEKEEEKLRRWSVAPNVAPVLFNSFGKGSSIDDQFNSNNRTSDVSLSFGLKGSYAVNNRLKVTAGINRVNFNSTTNDIIALSDNTFASSTSGNNLENVALNSSVNNESLTLLSRTNINEASIPGAINTIQTGDLNQNFGFIEIPLELEYRVIDKKIGLNLSGGFSTLILNENEIFADINGQSTRIGEASNINNTSFSANIGLGLDYGLSEKININLEPKFKYQLNTFNNTSGDFRPFFIGVYTGLSFKF